MAVFEQTNTVLTTVGRTLLADAQLGKGRIKITRVLARENFETAVSTLRAYTLSDIPDSSIAQEGHVLSTQIAITHPDPEQEVETSLLTVRFSNDELESSTATYNLRQIIVMARLVDINSDENLPYADDLGEVPYMVAQCSSYDEPDLMPPREDNPTSLDYDIYVIHSGVPTITIELRTSGYVFVDTYNTDKTEIWTSINELRDNAVGQNTKDLTFNTWNPVYSSNRAWSSESTGDTATGQKSAERFNQYGNDKNIAIGNNSSAFGYNTEVLGNEGAAFGVSNYIGATATQTLVAGSCNTVRAGAYNVVFGAFNEVANGTANNVSGQANQVTDSTSNTIVSGLRNTVDSVQDSVITGEGVEVHNAITSIVSGFGVSVGSNESSPNDTISSIITGISVTVDKGLKNSLIVGNDISVSSNANQYVTAIGNGIDVNSSDVTAIGSNIALSGNCNYTTVFGTSHEVSSAQSVFIAGNGNTISASTSVASVAFNYNNTINASAHSAVFGYSNTITYGENTVSYGTQNSTTLSNNTLVGGYVNNVTSSANALVVGGNHTVYGANNSIIYGNAVTATPDDTESLIGGNNCRVAHSSRSVVSGNNLTVDWATDSSIHGINNRVYGERQTHSNLIAGNSNIIHNDGGLGNADNGKSLIVGTNNEVADYSDSSLSGSDNKLKNIMESSVTGRYITVHTIANQSRSIGVRNCSISGYNVSVTQFENSVITGNNHTLTDYKPNNVAGEWNINSCNNLIGGDSLTVAGIYSSVVAGFNHDIENIHDSVIAGRDNTISGGSTPAGGVTNSVLAVGSRLNITNVQKPQAVFGSDNVVTSGGNILVSGHHLVSSSDGSVTFGKYNVADTTSQYAVVVGGGTADNNRSNICTLDWSGNLHVRGLYVSDILNEDGTPKDFGGNANISSGSGVQSILINDVTTNKATGIRSTAMGNNNTASGENSIAVGNTTQAQGVSSISAGDNTKTTSDYSLVGGYGSQCINASDSSIVWGRSTTATFSPQSTAFGYSNTVSFANSGFVSGINNVVSSELGTGAGTADNIDASAILGGENGYVNAHYSAIIGGKNNKIGYYAETGEVIKTGVILGGENNSLRGERCVVLGGYANSVGGYNSIVGGSSNNLNSSSNNMIVVGTSNNMGTINNNSAVFGSGNKLNAHESFVAGRGLDTGTTTVIAQTILGKWNTPDANSLLIVGNGSDDDNRSNALRVDQSGNIFCGSDAQSLNAKIAFNQTTLEALETAMNIADAAVVARGSKNLLKNTATSSEVNGITFTVNADGSVTATGTATANADFTISNLTGYPTSGQYILSGCPEGGGVNTYRIQIYQVATDYGEGVEFASRDRLNVYIRINSGQTVDNLTFYPMIRSAAISDNTYQPYAPSNRELFEGIEPILAAFPFALQRGEYTLNDQSELTFDTLVDTKYYRYTASAIGNPVPGGYGIIINIRYTSYAVQLLFSQTTAVAPTQMLYRIGTNMSTTPTWKAWQIVSTGSGGGSATITSLWSSTSGATINTEYTLNDSINNYDAIYLKISTENDVNLSNTFATTSFLTQFYDINQSVEWQGYLQRALTAKFNGNKFTQTVTTSTEGAGYSPKIYQIIGVKFGTGTNTSTTVKTLTYTGDGKDTTSITFPDTPTVILSIDGPGTGTGMVNLSTFRFGAKAVSGSWSDNDSGSTGNISLRADYSGDTLLLTKGQNSGARCNVAGETYTVTYM